MRALNEIPTAKVALFSWTLLPSMATVYILLFLVVRISGLFGAKRRINYPHISAKDSSRLDIFVIVSLLFALLFIFLGLLARMHGVELIRYLVVPSYVILIFAVSIVTIRVLTSKIGLLLLLLFLAPYLYSAIYSPERISWMGEVRLAPVTYTDRVEMLPLVRYAKSGYYIYCWHDAYLPIERVKNPPRFLVGGGSYYPIHNILKVVANDTRVNIPVNSLLIVHKDAINSQNFSNYDIILDGHDHLVMSPK